MKRILFAFHLPGINFEPETWMSTSLKGRLVRLRFTPPSTLAAGQYYVIASLDSTSTIPERDETNNTAVSAGTFTVG